MRHVDLLRQVFRASLLAMDLEARTFQAMRRRANAPAAVLAIGKAAPAMLAGATRALGHRMLRALMVVPEGLRADPSQAELLVSDHPLPTERSAHAGKRIQEFLLHERRANGSLVVLVSGGASSLVAAPFGVSLEEKRSLTRELFQSGAPIQEVNVVRRHLSLLKGGGIVRMFAPHPVLTLYASDVLSGGAWDVGSGPATWDPTTRDDARRVLHKAGLPFPPQMRETLKPWELAARRSRSIEVASGHAWASAAAELLRAHGFRVTILPPQVEDVGLVSDRYVSLAKTLGEREAAIAPAEPVLALPRDRGKGGRATHLAALLAARLSPGITFGACTSDGVDGTSGTAGAIVDASLASCPALHEAIARHDTGSALCQLGVEIPGGHTGHNLADLHILVR